MFSCLPIFCSFSSSYFTLYFPITKFKLIYILHVKYNKNLCDILSGMCQPLLKVSKEITSVNIVPFRILSSRKKKTQNFTKGSKKLEIDTQWLIYHFVFLYSVKYIENKIKAVDNCWIWLPFSSFRLTSFLFDLCLDVVIIFWDESG